MKRRAFFGAFAGLLAVPKVILGLGSMPKPVFKTDRLEALREQAPMPKILFKEETIFGTTPPPLHPYCRCVVIESKDLRLQGYAHPMSADEPKVVYK